MSARFASPDPQLNENGGGMQSNYSTERTPKTALLFAAKKYVLLPSVRSENGQSAMPDHGFEHDGRSERSIQE